MLDFDNGIDEQTDAGAITRSLRRSIESLPKRNIAMVAEGKLLYVMDRESSYYRIFRPVNFTEIFIVFEVGDTGNLTKLEESFHENVLTAFLKVYRLFSQDVAIRMLDDLEHHAPVIRAGVHEYSTEEMALSEERRISVLRDTPFGIASVPLGANPRTLNPPAFDPAVIGPRMSALLASGDPISPPQDILVKALEELKVAGDFRYAFLLAFFSIEQVITDLLRAVKIERGVPPRKLKDHEKNIGISYMINVELALVLRRDHPVRALIPQLNGVNTIRNGVVHKSREVNYREAAHAINIASKLMEML